MHQHHQSFNGCDATDQKKYNTRPDRNPPAAVYEASDPRAANAARVVPEKAKRLKSGDCAIGYRHRPIKTTKQLPSGVPCVAWLRVKEIEALIEHRHGGFVDTDDDEVYGPVLADHLVHYPVEAAHAVFRRRLPRLSAQQIDGLMADAHECQTQWLADEIGTYLRLTVTERRELDIRTIGALGTTPETRKAEAMARRNATKRAGRAAKNAAQPRPIPKSQSQPWRAANISRTTWYERQKKAKEARTTDGRHINKHPYLVLGDDLSPMAAASCPTRFQAEKPDRRNNTHVSAGHRPEPNTIHNRSKPKGETDMADIVFTEAEDASNNAAEACAAARAAGRSDAAIVEAMLALAGRPDIDADTPKGAGFVVAFAASFDASVAKVKAQVADLNSRPEVRGRIGLAARLFEKFDGDVEMTCAVLRDSPRNPASSLAARMATASIEPTVGAPFGATPDPDAGWTKAIDAANRKKALS